MIATLSVAARGTQDAAANGDTRTLTLFHTHTRESLTVTYRRNGQYDDRALEQLNWLLRDWRRDEPTRMDPRLFDILWEVYRETGSDEPIHVLSAYRSPKTNAMLRRRSSRVAEHSQHMLGKAMDFHLPDVSVDRIRAIGMRLQSGGVGYYPSSSFVHLDVGSVRAWPRMTRDQLLRLFPDGRTVHLPADGTPLPGYEEARAQVLARGGTVAGVTAVADAGETTGTAPRRRGFWATLFGLDEDEDAEEIRTTQAASRTAAGSGSAVAVRYTPGDESSASNFLDSYNRWRAQQSAPQVAQRAPQPAPEPASVVRVAEAPAPVREPAPARLASLAAAQDGSAAPRLAWQGPGSAAEDQPPIPPRRPSDLLGALAFAPTPAARRDEAPVFSGAALVGIPHPLPPPRPGGRPVQVAALESVPVPVATGSVKTAASRTAQPVATTPRAAGKADRPSSSKGDRLALKDVKPTKGAAPAPAPAGKTKAAASPAAAKSPPPRSGDKPSPQRPAPKARVAAR